MSWRENPNHWRNFKENYETGSIRQAINDKRWLQNSFMKELQDGGNDDESLSKIERAEREIAELEGLLKAYDHSQNEKEHEALQALETKRKSLEKEITKLEKKLQHEDGSDEDFKRLDELYQAITGIENAIDAIVLSKSARSGGTRKKLGKRKRKTRARR